MTNNNRRRPPLVLIINDQEWSTRSLESILGPSGYAVLRAYTGRKGLERIRTASPDLIMVDINLPDFSGIELCSIISRSRDVSPSVPIIITTASHPSRSVRLQALRAGAWDFLSHPFDPEELILQLDAYMRAKFHTDEAISQAMLDQDTGLYNLKGLVQRARELGSQAYRQSSPLACVAFTVELDADSDETSEELLSQAVMSVAEIIRQAGRTSDIIGRLGKNEFGIVAPETDATGAVRLAERIGTAIDSLDAGHRGWKLNAGFDAVSDFRESPIEPSDLLQRATQASRISNPSTLN